MKLKKSKQSVHVLYQEQFLHPSTAYKNPRFKSSKCEDGYFVVLICGTNRTETVRADSLVKD